MSVRIIMASSTFRHFEIRLRIKEYLFFTKQQLQREPSAVVENENKMVKLKKKKRKNQTKNTN